MEICLKIDQPSTGEDVIILLKNIINNQTLIMTAIEELKGQVAGLETQVTDLQTALDTEQAQIQQLLDNNASIVSSLRGQVDTLTQQLANGATAEQIQEVSNSLSTIANSIATTKADLEGTVSTDSTGGSGL